MIGLAIDAATYTGTVAVIRDDVVVAAGEAVMRGEREERLMPAVAAVLEAAGVSPADLGVVVCGAGPGSFTSLRIAASIAKGIAFAGGIPLRTVSSLLLTACAAEPPLAAGRYLAVLDALRGEAYTQLVEVATNGLCALREVALMPVGEVGNVARAADAVTVGPGQVVDARPQARGVVRLVRGLDGSTPVDAAAWEPTYGRLAEAQVRWEAAHGKPLGQARA